MRAQRVWGPIVVAVVAAVALASCATAGATPSKFASAAPAPQAAPAEVPAAAPSTVPPAPPTPAAPVGLADGTPCKATVVACVKLSTKQAWLIEDGKAVYGPVPITSGRAGWRTPPGTFPVTFKEINHKSRLFNDAPMPYSVFFNGGIAFHQGSLSQPSHGCIHLSLAAAKAFYAALAKGNPVQVVA